MSDWSFENFYLWKNMYPECSANEQSPINISTDNLKECNLMCQLETYYKHSKCKVKFTKNNMLVLEYDFGSRAKFSGNFYNLTEIIICTPSMHTIDNEKFEAEIMMIHRSDQSDNKDSVDNGLITCKLLNRYNKEYGPEQDFLNEFIFRTPKVPFNDNALFETIDVSERWSADLLNPKERSSFFMYDGSLPFPPCNEKYKVIVYEEIGNIGNVNLKLLKENVGKNNRPVQDLGNRKIFYNPGRVLKKTSANEDTLSTNKFLKCEKREDPLPIVTQQARESSSFTNEKLEERTFQIIKNVFMGIAVLALIVLAYYFTLYLYRQMYIQKTLKSLLPKDVYLGVEESWKACSETTGVKIDKMVNTNKTNIGTEPAPIAESASTNSSGNAEGPAKPLNTNTNSSQEL
jgi:carbonic anhydrase